MFKRIIKKLWYKFLSWMHNGYDICGLCGASIFESRTLEAWERHSYLCAGQNVVMKVVSKEEFLKTKETGLIKLSFEEFLSQHKDGE